MKKCLSCAEEIEDRAMKCKHCQAYQITALNVPQKASYMNFGLFITPTAIMVLHMIVLVIAIVVSALIIFSLDDEYSTKAQVSATAIILVIWFAYFMYRIFSELAIILFKIHEKLARRIK